jgi:hypothetical protein
MKNKNYNADQILDVFANNPEIDSVIITSDGNCFTPKFLGYAKNHAMEFKLTYETLTKEQFKADEENASTQGTEEGSEVKTGEEGSEAKAGEEGTATKTGEEGSEAKTGEEGSEAKTGEDKSAVSKVNDSDSAWKVLSFTEIVEFAKSKGLDPKTPKTKGKVALVAEVEMLLSQTQK